MNINTVLLLSENAIEAIDQNPTEWWKETRKQISFYLDSEPFNGIYSFENYKNCCQIISVHSADNVRLIAAGCNHASIIPHSSVWNHCASHNEIDDQIKLLEENLRLLKISKKNQDKIKNI